MMYNDDDESIRLLMDQFPDFCEGADLTEGPYSILGDFAIYVRDGLDQRTIPEPEVSRIFEFLNALGASSDIEIQNQLVVGVLEILTDSSISVNACKEMLRGNALDLFNRVLEGWMRE